MQTEAQQKAAEKNILNILKYLKYLEIFRNTRPGLVDPGREGLIINWNELINQLN